MLENAEAEGGIGPFVVGYSRSTSARTKHLCPVWDDYSLCHRRVTDFDGVYPSRYKLRCESLPVCKTCERSALAFVAYHQQQPQSGRPAPAATGG
ncbi:MAG TPA: hypothetical protein VFP61_11770 [Acidimicrobiales bacterium]|nr:hypothetical protein [Acidimicrobiales bacterium]